MVCSVSDPRPDPQVLEKCYLDTCNENQDKRHRNPVNQFITNNL